MRAHGDVDAPVPLRLFDYGAKCGAIVWIYADENVVIAVLDGCKIACEHPRDHVMLTPQGNENRDAALRCAEKSGGRGQGKSAGQKRGERDQKVVQAAD